MIRLAAAVCLALFAGHVYTTAIAKAAFDAVNVETPND